MTTEWFDLFIMFNLAIYINSYLCIYKIYIIYDEVIKDLLIINKNLDRIQIDD